MLSNVHTVKRVCSIRFILVLRFMFGFYSDIHKSPVMRTLCKLYCVAIICLLNYIYYINALDFNRIIAASSIIESIFFAMISLYNKEEYILDFFRYRSITDILPFAKETFKLMEKLLILYGVCVIVLNIISFLLICVPYDLCYSGNSFPILISIIQSLSLEVGSISFVLIFTLLYCRVHIIKNTLLRKGFTYSPRHRFSPKKYLQMYEAVLESMEDADNPLSLLIFSFMMTCFPSMIFGMYYSLTHLKEHGPTYTHLVWLFLAMEPLAAILLSAILLDLAAVDVVDMKCFIVAKRLESKNERELSELQLLFMMIEDNPIQYNLCRVFRLSLKNLLSIMSFTFTTIIAILQIQNF